MFDHAYRQQHKTIFDIIYFALFLCAIIVGAMLINSLVFRSYTVVGSSMEATLHEGDHLMINELPVSWAHLWGGQWVPARGQVIVFRNPLQNPAPGDEFVVKRVMGLPGERVVVKDGTLTIYNQREPGGFQPDQSLVGPKSPTSGTVDITVPEGELFVAGDNRIALHSLDSRNGLSTIPLRNVQGSVAFRFYPFNQLRSF